MTSRASMLLAVLACSSLTAANLMAQDDRPPADTSAQAHGGVCESLIAFASSREEAPGLYVVNAEGGEARLVVEVPGVLQIAWLPGARRIAFLSVRPEDEELFTPYAGLRFHAFLYTVNVDGTDLRRVGDRPMTLGLTISPDGGRFAFASSAETEGESRIYLIDADGGNLRPLTDLAGAHFFPAWSPDGRLIAFTQQEGEQTVLRLVSPDGSESRALIEEPSSSVRRLLRPVWAPDGAMLAFGEGRAAYIMGAYEGTAQRIHSGTAEPYAWSPSKSKVLMGEAGEGTGGRVFLIDLDTLEERRLADRAGVGGASSPSPAWDRVAYTAIADGQSDVVAVGTEGDPGVNLTNHPANEYFPQWSPCTGSDE